MANPLDEARSDKEFEEARCPICMDHPHNAVQLICSNASCTCFICNTSLRHSNCLDRFNSSNGKDENKPLATCPMCRGTVIGWRVDSNARSCMDLKSRSCSEETCEFDGNYEELRCHVRKEHPTSRPGTVDPTRQRQWDQFETQQQLNDVLSALRSAVPGVVVEGDYAIEPDSEEEEEEDENANEHRAWWDDTLVFFDDTPESPIGSETPVSRRRTRRYVWGETLLGLSYNDNDNNNNNDEDENNDGEEEGRYVARRRLDGDEDVHTRRRRLDDNHD